MNRELTSAVLLLVSISACGSENPPQETSGAAGTSPMSAGAGGGASSGGSAASAGSSSTAGATSSGGAASAGESGTGGIAAGGSAGTESGQGGARIVSPCPEEAGGSGAIGVWQDISPAGVDIASETPLGANFGYKALVIDPLDTTTLYVGTDTQGIWKTTDCGADWFKVNTGKNADAVSSGRNWSIAIDPVDPKVLYQVNGYGVMGVFKTTNGGVDWEQTMSDEFRSTTPYNGFVMRLALDPSDHLHLLAAFHANCLEAGCIAETKDGGATWNLLPPDPAWVGGAWPAEVDFLDSTHWIFAADDVGIWTSSDSGVSWNKVSSSSPGHLPGQLYRGKNGGFFQGCVAGVLYSPDGASWSILSGSPSLVAGVVGDGTNVYVSKAFPYAYPGVEPYEPFYTVSETSPTTVVPIDSPAMGDGGLWNVYDPDHRLLYSSAAVAGLWRVTLPP